MIELLAPAKDKKCAMAAINYGADAVYIGANDFGARKNAPNPLSDIEEVINHAHKFNVKVYVTINTILNDQEIIQAKELIEKLYKIGADAIIIQDMGLLELDLPPIKIFASTQCDNRTTEKVKFLQDAGFSRVILARELSIEQIKEIKKHTNVELETFIHGALCVSYSGQCYLSNMIGGIGGRSANRGECAQPCRKKYSLVERWDEEENIIAKDKYLLCLKDFNASKHIKELAQAGVTSFKIEGRLKDETYVKNVVAYYRKLIDELGLQKTSSGKVILDFEPDVNKSFNRGFTDYFLQKRHACYNFETPKSMGEYVGKVSKVGADYFEISLPSPLAGEGRVRGEINPQDGLCFLNNGELQGSLVNKIDKNKIYPNKMGTIKTGMEIYRNFDAEFEKKLNNSKTCRKIEVNIEFDLDKVSAKDDDGNFSQIKYDFEELAQNPGKMGVNIISQFKKSGESDFLVSGVNIKTQKIPFLPVSKLNELRRELLEKLMTERLKNYKKEVRSSQKEKTDYPQTKVDFRGNVLSKYAKNFYEKHGCKVIEQALESNKTSKSGKVAMTTKHCLKHAFNLCKSPKKLYLVDEKGKRYELKFDCKKCEMEIVF